MLVCGTLIAELGCGSPASETTEEPSASVQTVTIGRGPVTEVVETYGTVEFSPTRARVVPVIRSGQVREVAVHAGQQVRKGDRLIVLGPIPEQSPAAHQAKIELQFARKALERIRRLASLKLATHQDIQIAERAVALSRANLRGLGLEGKPDLLVLAPIDATVVDVPVTTGSVLRAAQTAVWLAPESAVAVRVGLELGDMNRLLPGQATELSPIYLAGGQRADQDPVQVRLPEFLGRVDPGTQLVEVLIDVAHPKPWLLPGERVRVRVTVEREEDALRVPLEAVIERGSVRGVFVIRESRAHWVPIRVKVAGESWLAVQGDLAAGDTVATLGRSSLEDGILVRDSMRAPAG